MAGRILIADDVSTHRIILKTRLAEAAYQVNLARDPAELLREAARARPDLMLIADPMAGSSRLELMQRLRALPQLTGVPRIVMQEDLGRDARIAAIRAGADAVVGRLPETPLVRARVRNLMRRSAQESELRRAMTSASSEAMAFAEPASEFAEQPGQIAIIAESLAEGLIWRNGLSARMRDRIAVLDPAHPLADLDKLPPPDAIVVGEQTEMPEAAIQLVSDLRSRAETLNAAVVLVQRHPNQPRTIAALDLGVCEVVDDGFDAPEMAQILRREIARKARDDSRRAELQDGLRLANTDPLTGLHNRRSALLHLGNVMQQAETKGQGFAVMVLDLDRFKAVNDKFGHAAGDTVLTKVTNRMQACLRRGDFMARIGGEEFLAVIRNCDLDAARVAAERLRHAVAAAPVELPLLGVHVDVTVSIGMVIGGAGGAQGTAAELIDLADRGLYASKAEGRNQVTVYRSAA